MNKALIFLSKKDSNMKKLIEKYGEISINSNYMKTSGSYFTDLISSIISQQLSVKVANSLLLKLKKLCNNQITPKKIILMSDDKLRNIGCSKQKIIYLKSFANAVCDQIIKLDNLINLSDEEVINQLVQIKGIGVWTAKMFLIFSLQRLDVFAVEDLGLRNAIKKIYNITGSKNEYQKIAENWKPYRTYASLLLWKSLNNLPNYDID